MRHFEDLSDVRLRGPCAYCGEETLEDELTKDHVPSKGLLDRPYPAHLPTVPVHLECNSQFSSGEEYLALFLASVICDSTDVDPKRFPRQARALARNTALRQRIGGARADQTEGGEAFWRPELERVERVIVKNAKGHVLFESGQSISRQPDHVAFAPLLSLPEETKAAFESLPDSGLWAEVGSRKFQKQVLDFGRTDINDWHVVQENRYRYAVDDSLAVRMVLFKYLAAEVAWTD